MVFVDQQFKMWRPPRNILLVILMLSLCPDIFCDLGQFTFQRFNCPRSYTFTNARLHGGLQAGQFRRLGPPDDTELCVQRCCDQRSCDLVAWIGDHCYSVTCVNRELCKPVRLPSYDKGMRLLYIASRENAEDEVEPNRREVSDMLHLSPNDAGSINITKSRAFYSASHQPTALKSRRIIRSLEEIEDEDGSGVIKRKVNTESANDNNENELFNGNYYERNSESMKFKMAEPPGEEDWEGGLIESSSEQDDDVTDDIIQTQTHSVTAVKRTKMASVVSPSDIERFEPDSDDASSENLQEDEDTVVGFSSSGASGANALFSDEIQDLQPDGSGKINKTIMREVQRNLHKVWRYASSGKNLDMLSKGPKGKEEEDKLQEIYNLVIKHESGRTEPMESVPGESASGLNMGDDLSDESGSGEDDIYEKGSAIFQESGEKPHVISGDDDISGESSGLGGLSEISGNSASGSGEVNTNLLREVERNLHKVWRYAAPKKDLDMVARGPKGKEEEQKVKKIYNIVSKHETGSAFIDFELRKKGKPLSDSERTPKHQHGHKSRKSRVKLTMAGYNATEEKLYRLQIARKYKYNKNLKSLKPWGMGMEKLSRKPGGKNAKKIARNENGNGDNLAILGEEMKELAPTGKKADKTIDNENSKAEKLRKSKSDEEDTATEKLVNDTASKEIEHEHETTTAPDKSESEKIVLDKQEPFDKTQLEIGKKLEELILSRMAQLESQGIQNKHKEKQEHFKEGKEKDDQSQTGNEPQKAAQAKQDKLLMKLENLKFLNGPSTVYKESRFVYLKQCGLYVEEYNVSKTRASWNNDLFSPYSYLYEMPKNYHTCNSSVRMNSTDLRGDVFLSFRVMSIKGSTMTNNANICEKYCCQEPRCQAWTLRFQQADTANCPKGSFCCWLKSAIPTPIRDSEHCTSGIVHRESTKHPPSGMRSAVPLGGLGTGSFELRADGTIHEWTIENQSPGGSAKLNKGALNLAAFGVRVGEPDRNKSEAALLRIHAPHGYPGVESLSYSGSFPVSKLTPGGSITENIDMSLYAFPSFHVRDRFKSAVPAVAFTLGMRNKADKPLDVSFMFNLPLGQQEDTIRVGDNYGEVVFTRMIKPSDCAHACSKMPKCMSWTTNGPTSCLLKDKMPLHAWATGIVSGLKGEWNVQDSMLTCHRPGFFPQSGSTTLYAVDNDDRSGSFAVADDFHDIWTNFSNTGEIGVPMSLNKTGLYGAASVKTQLQPGEKKSLTLIMSWYYPHRDVAKVHVGNLYSTMFKSSQDVAKHMREDLVQSVIDIQSWHEPIVGSEPVKKAPINDKVKHVPNSPEENKVNQLPDWLKDLLVNSMSFWRSGFWAEDGRWRQWEAFDCNDIDTIQNDMQRIIPSTLFFPELVRDLLTSWADNQYSSGMLQEALTSGCLGPTGKLDYAGGRVMADTTAMFVVGLYHYYQWTGDQATLDRLWPAAKRAVAWVMVDSTKGTGLPFRKVSTYDIVALDKFDHDAYNSFIYLLALRAAQELGTITNDTKFVPTVRQSFNHAQKRVDTELWDNAKHYYHAWWDMEYGSPEWIMSDSLYGQVWAYSLGLGDLVPRSKLKEHLLREIEKNDSPFGLKVLSTGEVEISPEDTSIILSRHIPGCKSLENITKHNSVWMGADADWSSLMLHLDTDPIIALNRAKKSLDHWRSTLNDQWNVHGLISSNGYGLDGLPWATSHYSFHLVLWHIPLALSGQQYFAPNASLTFWPKFPIPFNLPFFTPKASGTIEGAYVNGNDRDEDDNEEEEMFTFTVKSGELNLKELAILGSKYGEGEISIKEGEAITWSRPKQDVKNILQQL